MTELRRRMIQDMRLRGLAAGTQRAYLYAVRSLAGHYRRPPDQLSEADIRHYFTHLLETKCLGHGTIRLQVAGIKFFYTHTLRRAWPVFTLIRVKRPKRLPSILTPAEVRVLLDHVRRPTIRMSLLMMYSCGLRVSEATHLKAHHIDSVRMVVSVRGKGDKERHVPLPEPTLGQLRAYWVQQRPGDWLFPALRSPQQPITPQTVRKALAQALSASGIAKKVSCHTLRHSYATGLLERGLELPVIQGLLGHRSPRTTFIYLHMTSSVMATVHDRVNTLLADF